MRQRAVKQAPPPGKAGRRAPPPREPNRWAPIFDDRVARTASIPIGLWICAAVVAHLAGGGGAMEAAQTVHDRDELKAAVRSVRERMHPSDTTFEILTDSAEPMPAAKVEPPKVDAPTDGTKADSDPDPDAVKEKAPKPKDPPKPKEEAKKPEPPKVEPPKPPPPKPKPEVPLPATPAPAPPPPPPPPPEHRIAVRQHVDKNQPDNPNAPRIADDANHVEKETMAKARSKDQDLKDPTFGASKTPKAENAGTGDDHDKVADSEDRKGNDKHAPGEKNDRATDTRHETPKPPVPPSPVAAKAPPPGVPGNKGGQGAAPAIAPPPPSPGGAGPASPEVIAGDRGSYTLDPANPGGDGKSRTAGKRRPVDPFQTPVHVGSIGLGGPGLPGGPQLNLDMKGVESAVGAEQFRAERAADGAARRSAHRGGKDTNKFQKYRAAIENYDPRVELGNTTALNAARVPFASYLNAVHNRIHPIFAEEWLEFLDGLPKGHALNQDLKTFVEIVLNKDTGKIVSVGITKPSGVTAFDVAALSAVDRAGPFGKAPDIIASPDGNVYFHWEFHRDHVEACGTANARPFILKNPPKARGTSPLGPRKKTGTSPHTDEPAPAPLLPLREH